MNPARACYAAAMKQIAFIACLALLLPLAGCGPHARRTHRRARQPPPQPKPLLLQTRLRLQVLTSISSIFPGRRSFASRILQPPNVPRIPPSSSTACGRKTTTAPIRRIVRMRPAPPTRLNIATCTPTRDFLPTNGKRTAPVLAWARTHSSRPPALLTAPSQFRPRSPVSHRRHRFRPIRSSICSQPAIRRFHAQASP